MMRWMTGALVLVAAVSAMFTLAMPAVATAAAPTDAGWISLFNGENLDGWKLSEAAAESWTVKDGVIDCDPRSTKDGDASLWSEGEYGDFILHVEWRITDAPTTEQVPVVLPDGSNKVDSDGKPVTVTVQNADSGIYLRGQPKAQVNIWNWPVGSGEVYGYRTDGSMTAQVRAGVTPSTAGDKPVGAWNTFIITMIGDRLSVILNGQLVINHAQLPGVAASGPLALQYHGGYDHANQRYLNGSSLVQFRNIYVKRLE